MSMVIWKKFKKYKGPSIKGSVLFELPKERREHHVDRAFWLTTKVETGGKFGSVMAYDGTGMTAGLDQHIAVYPKELAHEDYNAADDQGGLWKLLRRMEYAVPKADSTAFDPIETLWREFEKVGWYLAQDGVLRYLDNNPNGYKAGDVVFGREIRNTFTPVDGCVEENKNKDIAMEWIYLFHDVFRLESGFSAQIEFGKEHLIKRTRRWNAEWPYKGEEITALKVEKNIDLEMDLAMCMYHSHSVNAPGIAIKLLKKSRKGKNTIDPKKLIRLLGNSSYGRWDDDIKNGRYQRTRSAARASGLWPRSMFDGSKAIMPKDLPG